MGIYKGSKINPLFPSNETIIELPTGEWVSNETIADICQALTTLNN
jgi:hypothetical protein